MLHILQIQFEPISNRINSKQSRESFNAIYSNTRQLCADLLRIRTRGYKLSPNNRLAVSRLSRFAELSREFCLKISTRVSLTKHEAKKLDANSHDTRAKRGESGINGPMVVSLTRPAKLLLNRPALFGSAAAVN